jgi:hypothetical protein
MKSIQRNLIGAAAIAATAFAGTASAAGLGQLNQTARPLSNLLSPNALTQRLNVNGARARLADARGDRLLTRRGAVLGALSANANGGTLPGLGTDSSAGAALTEATQRNVETLRNAGSQIRENGSNTADEIRSAYADAREDNNFTQAGDRTVDALVNNRRSNVDTLIDASRSIESTTISATRAVRDGQTLEEREDSNSSDIGDSLSDAGDDAESSFETNNQPSDL